MKPILLSIALSMLCQLITLAQTPEQMKQMEAAKHKADSIMNSPQMKEMMQKAKAMEAKFAKQEAQRKKSEKLKPREKPAAKVSNNNVSDFYWYNTIGSDTNGTFKDWSYGAASLRVGFYDRKAKAYIYLPFGSISAAGQVKIELPQIDETKLPFKPITKDYSEGENIFYNNALQFTNTNAKWVSTRFNFEVYKGDKTIGYIKIGNHIKPVVNLNSPCCTHKAGDGYSISWVFVTTPTNITGAKTLETGGKVVHNLNFTKGWNLLKIAVDGSTSASGDTQQLWLNKEHAATTTLPSDAKYYFTKH